MLDGDPRAEAFAAKVRDVHEVLAELEPPATLRPLEIDWQAGANDASGGAGTLPGRWVGTQSELDIGLPAPLRGLLERLLPT